MSVTCPCSADVVPVTAGGAGAALRPLRPEEHTVLDAVFDGLSPASRHDRYLTGLPQLTGPMRSALTAVDGHTHIAWLGEVDGHPAAIGRLVRVARSTAEIAFEVIDAHQGRGLGTALVDTLMTVASVSGIDTIQATVLPSNRRSLRLLTAIGMTFRVEDGLLEGTAPVRLRDTPVVDRGAVVRLALCAQAGPGRGLSTTFASDLFPDASRWVA
jgi:GNAT superfamily N-acetyltransferase